MKVKNAPAQPKRERKAAHIRVWRLFFLYSCDSGINDAANT
jgi:hypothetical protein